MCMSYVTWEIRQNLWFSSRFLMTSYDFLWLGTKDSASDIFPDLPQFQTFQFNSTRTFFYSVFHLFQYGNIIILSIFLPQKFSRNIYMHLFPCLYVHKSEWITWLDFVDLKYTEKNCVVTPILAYLETKFFNLT